ncbi:MAG: Arc family DNA binding domain-containing protein [Planctomycetes bacterium]|nr:Arc family DNA binding domain-containing protein [Planctomycetota bacterium]
MAERKPYLLRLPRDLMDDLERWAKDELRSVNAQLEYLLRDAVRRRRRRSDPRENGTDFEPPPKT